MTMIKYFAILTLSIAPSFLLGQEFGFSNLIFSSEGVELRSRELPKFENLVVNVAGIHGFTPVEGMASLGMEVHVTNSKNEQLMFSPDMFDKQEIPIEKVPLIDFNFDLVAKFEVGSTYFLKVRLWDRHSNKEMTKETSIKVLPPIQNKNIKTNAKVFELLTSRVYLNKNRYYDGNYVRKGDELYVDMFFDEIEFEGKVSMDYKVEVLNPKTNEVIPVEEDVMVLNDPTQLNNLNYSIVMDGQELQVGNTYEFHILFKVESLGAEFDLRYEFHYLDEGSIGNTEIVENENNLVFFNREKAPSKFSVKPGGRVDMEFRNLNSIFKNENNTNRIGGMLLLKDKKGNEITRSVDLFEERSQVSTDKTSEITMHWNASWDLEENQKYQLVGIVWDKYSKKKVVQEVDFKTEKIKDRPFGKDLNPSVKSFFDLNKVEPIAVYVLVNGYRFEGNELRPGDVVYLKISARKKEGVLADGFKTLIEVRDAQDQLLSENTDRSQNFTEGEVFATITVPYSGEEIGKTFKVIAKLTDFREEVFKAEYEFKVVK